MRLIYKIRNNKVLETFLKVMIIIFITGYTFSMPAFSGLVGKNIITYFMMAALLGFTFIYLVFYGGFHFKKRLCFLPLFCSFALIGTLIFSKEYRGWLTVALLLVTFFVFYFAFCVFKNERIVLRAVSIAFFLFGLYFAYTYKNEILHLKINDRLGRAFDNENLIGSYFSLSACISFYIGIFPRKKIDIVFIAVGLFLSFLSIFTGSRASILLIGITFVATLFIRLKNHKLIFAIVMIACFALATVAINLPVLSFLKSQLERSLYTMFGIGKPVKSDASTLERAVWQDYGYYLGSKNLLIGFGVNGFSIYSGIGTYAHSNFAEVLCNFGIIGFCLFYSPFILCFCLSFKSKRKDAYLVILLTIYMFFRGFVGVSYNFKDCYLIFGIIYYLVDDAKTNVANEKILYIGSFNTKKCHYDGERIKTTLSYKCLENVSSNQIEYISLSELKLINTLYFIFCILTNKKSYKYVIISKDIGGAITLHKILGFLRFPFKKVMYFQIGPKLFDFIKQGKTKKELFAKDKCILVETDSMKQDLEGIGFDNVIVFPNFKPFVDVAFQEQNYSKEKLNLVYLSRIEPMKGIYDLIDCINDNGLNKFFNLDIYGIFMSEEDEKRINESCKNKNWVKYKGVLDMSKCDSYEILSHYDLHVFPTLYGEGFPGTLIDFFFAGVPTFSSSFKRSKDILNKDVDSIIYEQGNAEDLSAQLLRIYQNQVLLVDLRKNSYLRRFEFTDKRFEEFLKEKVL